MLPRRAQAAAELDQNKEERLVKQDRVRPGKLEEAQPVLAHKEVRMGAPLVGVLKRAKASNRAVVSPVQLERIKLDKQAKLAKVELAKPRVRAREARHSVNLATKIAAKSPKLEAALQAKRRTRQKMVTNRTRLVGPVGPLEVKTNSKRPILNSTPLNTNEPQVALWQKAVSQMIQSKLSKLKTFTLIIQEEF